MSLTLETAKEGVPGQEKGREAPDGHMGYLEAGRYNTADLMEICLKVGERYESVKELLFGIRHSEEFV